VNEYYMNYKKHQHQ